MIEYFTVTYYKDIVEKKKKREQKKLENTLFIPNKNTNVYNLFVGIFTLCIALFSTKLAYYCNRKTNTISRITSMLFAFFFPVFYLSFYMIWYILLGNSC